MKGALALLCALCAPVLAEPRTTATPELAPAGVIEHSRVEVAPAVAVKELSIDNPLGDVRIEGYDGKAILIETHKRAPDEASLDRLRVSLVPNPDGTVRITTTADGGREVQPVPRSAVRIDLVIRAPRTARITATAGSGKLELDNMDAGGELDTSSGAIAVNNVSGELWTNSVTGPMTLDEVFGSLDAAAVSADLELDTIGGDKLVASVNRGRIAGRRVRARDVELTSTEGKIMLEAEAALHGHLVVSSLRGDIDVRLRRHGAILIRARGSRVDMGAGALAPRPDGWVQTALGQGAQPALVELQSHYGTVRFVVLD